jgi:hypothetical protein
MAGAGGALCVGDLDAGGEVMKRSILERLGIKVRVDERMPRGCWAIIDPTTNSGYVVDTRTGIIREVKDIPSAPLTASPTG